MLEKDSESVLEWLCVNKLTLNVIKTEYMLIGSRQRLASLTDDLILSINGVCLKKTHSLKCLRLTVDDTLTWKSHVELIPKKIKMNLAITKKAKPYVNKQRLTSNHILITAAVCAMVLIKIWLISFKNYRTELHVFSQLLTIELFTQQMFSLN